MGLVKYMCYYCLLDYNADECEEIEVTDEPQKVVACIDCICAL